MIGLKCHQTCGEENLRNREEGAPTPDIELITFYCSLETFCSEQLLNTRAGARSSVMVSCFFLFRTAVRRGGRFCDKVPGHDVIVYVVSVCMHCVRYPAA